MIIDPDFEKPHRFNPKTYLELLNEHDDLE